MTLPENCPHFTPPTSRTPVGRRRSESRALRRETSRRPSREWLVGTTTEAICSPNQAALRARSVGLPVGSEVIMHLGSIFQTKSPLGKALPPINSNSRRKDKAKSAMRNRLPANRPRKGPHWRAPRSDAAIPTNSPLADVSRRTFTQSCTSSRLGRFVS
jgi:hypothetical protein